MFTPRFPLKPRKRASIYQWLWFEFTTTDQGTPTRPTCRFDFTIYWYQRRFVGISFCLDIYAGNLDD